MRLIMKRVFIIGDDSFIWKMLRTLFELERYSVMDVSGCEKGIKKY